MTQSANPISKLSVRQLVQVLKHAKGGSIGFDPFRDPRTSTRTNLLAHILGECTDAQIIAGVESLTVAAEEPKSANETRAQSQAETPASPVQADATSPSTPEFAPSEKPKTEVNPEAVELAVLLSRFAAKPALDVEQVNRLIERRFEEENDVLRKHSTDLECLVDAKLEAFKAPVVVQVQNTTTHEVKDLGIQHRCFPLLLNTLQTRLNDGHRLNVWLYGPAGTGKTTAAHKAADALSLKFYSNGTLLTEHSLSGFIDAGGRYHRTVFREAFEHGGVYLGDEFDGWCPKASLWLQAATANGWASFPDGMIQRHPDCVIIAGANTQGNGATADFVGRNKLDAAVRDRFVDLHWPLDEALETALCGNSAWVARVQSIRARAEKRKLKGYILTPRASFYGAALLAAGLPQEQVERMTLRKNLSDDQWAEIS